MASPALALDLRSAIRSIPDYPKPGIIFRDITTLIEDPEGFRESVERLADVHRGLGITHVAGIAAWDFMFGKMMPSTGGGTTPTVSPVNKMNAVTDFLHSQFSTLRPAHTRPAC